MGTCEQVHVYSMLQSGSTLFSVATTSSKQASLFTLTATLSQLMWREEMFVSSYIAGWELKSATYIHQVITFYSLLGNLIFL